MSKKFAVGTKVKANPNGPHELMMSLEAPGLTGEVVATPGIGGDDYMVQWENPIVSWADQPLSYGHADLLEVAS